jgi:HEAT repeat protein
VTESLKALYATALREKLANIHVVGRQNPVPFKRVFVSLTSMKGRPDPVLGDFAGLFPRSSLADRNLMPGGGQDWSFELDHRATFWPTVTAPEHFKNFLPERLLGGGATAFVTGVPGIGKTTYLRWLARETARDETRLPVFIALRRTSVLGKSFSDLLFEGIAEVLGGAANLSVPESAFWREHLIRALAEGRLSVFLDGLDEIPPAEMVPLVGSIREFVDGYCRPDGNTIVVSGRPGTLVRELDFLDHYRLNPWDNHLVRAFLDEYFPDIPKKNALLVAIAGHPDIAEVGCLPANLGLLVGLIGESDLIVDDRPGFRRQFLEFLLGRARATDEHRAFVRFVAADHLLDSRPDRRFRFSMEEIKAAAGRFHGETADAARLAEWILASPLLREVGHGDFAFAHLPMQELLAAEWLAQRDDFEARFFEAVSEAGLVELDVLQIALALREDAPAFYDALDGLPDMDDLVRTRFQARGLGYIANLPIARIERLGELLVREAMNTGRNRPLDPDFVLRSFSMARPEYRQILADGVVGAIRQAATTSRYLIFEKLEMLEAMLPEIVPPLTEEFTRRMDAATNSVQRNIYIWRLIRLGAWSPEIIKAAFNSESMGSRDFDVPMFSFCRFGVHNPESVARCFRTELSNVEPWNSLRLARFAANFPELFDCFVEMLRDENPVVQRNVTLLLTCLGLVRPEIGQRLIPMLRDVNLDVRRLAERILKAIGPEMALTSQLSVFLEESDLDTALRAVRILLHWDVRPAEVSATLAQILRRGKVETRRAVIEVLRNLKSPAPELIEAVADGMTDDDAVVRAGAAELLGRFGVVTEEILIGLADALRDDDPAVRANAAEALGLLRSPSVKVIARLGTTLCDEELVVRARAAQAIGRIGVVTPEITAACLELLQSDVGCVRMYAAEALGATAPATPEVVAGLSAALQDRNWNVRGHAVRALGWLGLLSPDLLTRLIRAARNEVAFVRSAAAVALGAYVATHVEAVEEVLRLLTDRNPDVASSAVKSLSRLATEDQPAPDIHARLIAALEAESSGVRFQVALLLGKLHNAKGQFSSHPPEIHQELCLVVREGKPAERCEAACILYQGHFRSHGLYVQLLDLIDDPKLDYRYDQEFEDWSPLTDFVAVLDEVEIKRLEIFGKVLGATHHPIWRVRATALRLLGVLQDRTTITIDLLLEMLRDKEPELRRCAAAALGRIGMATPEIIRGLKALVSDRDADVRTAAKAALKCFPVKIRESFFSLLQPAVVAMMNPE